MTINEIKEDCRVATYHTIRATKRNPAPPKEELVEQYKAIAGQHGWEVSRFFFDEGNSRAELDRLVADCKSGEIDLVLCKNIRHFGWNVKDLLYTANELTDLETPVGIWFEESEIFTLNDAGNLALTILGIVADEESRQKSMIMRNSWAARRKKEVNHE